MVSDKLYEMAFKYKKTKLWKKLWNTQIFAVKFSDDKIGYINIMGMDNSYNALCVYVGEEAYATYKNFIDSGDIYSIFTFSYQDVMFQQSCLQCIFDNKDDLEKDEQEEAYQYARKHSIHFRGSKSYPHFKKFQPGYMPWKLQEKQDENYLIEALTAAVEMAEILKTKSPQDVGIISIVHDIKTIPMIEFNNGKCQISSTDIPEIPPENYVTPKVFNDINVAKLKNIKKKGVWACEVIQYPFPAQNTPDEIPHFPMMFIAVDINTNLVLPIKPIEYAQEHPENMTNFIVDVFLSENICPKLIKVRDKRSYFFLEALCKKLKTKLSTEPELTILDDVEDELYQLIDDDMDMEMEMESVGETKSRKEKGEESEIYSYVIKVSYDTGCYRHIQISEDDTLFDLHLAILYAFEFDDDHAHVFFMDNKIWSDKDSYYLANMGEPRSTSDYLLSEVGLRVDKQFKYLFDFGDEWIFQCKVLRVVHEDTENPLIIKSKGKAPEQYGFMDDDLWDE